MASKNQGTRIPEGFVPTDKMREWFREKYGEVPTRYVMDEHETFMNYWIAKAGKDARKADWPRTWMNWIKRAAADRKTELGKYLHGEGPKRPPPRGVENNPTFKPGKRTQVLEG